MAEFEKGDRVAWSQVVAGMFPGGVTVTLAAVTANDPGAQVGTVQGTANDEETYFDVDLDDGDTLTLTGEEIVKVSE
jgi:hypothetical protein